MFDSETGFPYEITLEVTFRDLDALGHVNNAVFFQYFETVRTKYVSQILEHGGLVDANSELLDFPLILVRADCVYKSPALMSEYLQIGTGVSRFGNSSFDMLYKVLGQDGRLIAYGKTVQVMYDYVSSSAFPIPDSVRTYVDGFQQGWQLPDYS